MANFLTQVLDAGSQYDMPHYLKNRVRPTNIICLLMIFILAIPFTIISLIFFPKMAIFPGGAAVVAVGVLVVNSLGGIYYSRVVLPILLLILSSLYNAYFCESYADSISSVYLVELSFTLIPFVIFDFSEKGFLIFCTVFSFFIMAIFPAFWGYFDFGYDGKVLREGPLAVLTIILGTAFQISCITGLALINRQSEKLSNKLLDEMNEKNTEMEKARKALEGNVEQLEKARLAESHRQWAAEGIAKLSDVLRSNTDERQLYDKIIAMVVKYMKVNQGGLYIVEQNHQNETLIKLAACFAFDRKKYRQQTIEPGQGLLGQTYLEGEYIHLTDIPNEYISITSGLGDASPGSLLIVPLKVNETVEGLLELASFKKFAPHEIEFMLKLSETVGTFIRSNRINLQTRELLEQAQQQAEEMRAQEEEMRQNMEEMQATQEEMRRQSARNDGLNKELEAREQVFNLTTIMSESDPHGNILKVNDKLCEISQYSRAELIGKPHNIFRHPDMPKSVFKFLWQTIKQGKTFRGIVKNRAKDGSHYWVDAVISPVFDQNGKVVKYIGVRYVIPDDSLAEMLFDKMMKELSAEPVH